MSERRPPRNIQGMLKFCLEATKTEDAPADQGPRQLSAEEKKWLAEAMEAAMGKDPVKILIEDIQVLSNMVACKDGQDAEEKQINALEEITSYCEDLDLAKDFYTIGGYALLPRLVKDENSELRWRAADLIATLVQNHPFCQDAALDLDLMAILLKVLRNDEVELVKIKALYAISCLSRECERGQEELLKKDGLSALIISMQSENHKLQTKAAYIIAYLCSAAPRFKRLLTEMGVVEQLVALLHTNHAPHHEHIVSAILNILDSNPEAVAECRRPELQLRQLLNERIQLLKGKEEFLEEEEGCRQILTLYFSQEDTPDK